MSIKLPLLLRLSIAAALIALSQSTLAQSANNVYARVANSVGIVIITTYEGELVGSGSAVTVGPQTMVTNRHVLLPGHRYMVMISGNRLEAYAGICDPVQDLCLINVKGLDSKPVEFGDVKKIGVGDQVYTLGFPNEIGNVMGVSEATKQKSYTPIQSTLSNGLITALRPLDDGNIIQTNAAISPGSSGGGLFDATGKLIGITTFNMRSGQGLNMALPVNWVERMGVTGAPHVIEPTAEAVLAQSRPSPAPLVNEPAEMEQAPTAVPTVAINTSLPTTQIAASPAHGIKAYWWYAIPVVLIALFFLKRRAGGNNAPGGTERTDRLPASSNDPSVQRFMEAAGKEVDDQQVDAALWQMVLTESKGNATVARESYIKYRAAKLRSIEKDRQWTETASQTQPS